MFFKGLIFYFLMMSTFAFGQVQVKSTLSSFSVSSSNDSLLLVGGQSISGNTVTPNVNHGYLSLRYSSLAIEKENLNAWIIFPNPAEDVIYLEFSNGDSGILELYNLVGELIKTISIQTNVEMFDVSDLSPGTYYISYRYKGKQNCKKFIKI